MSDFGVGHIFNVNIYQIKFLVQIKKIFLLTKGGQVDPLYEVLFKMTCKNKS